MSAGDGALLSSGASPRPLPAARRRSATLWLNAFAIAALTAVAVVWQRRWGTVPDTSWLITVCERLLGGERLYIDVAETNPPFSTWLYMPPVALAQQLGIEPEILVHAWAYLAALAGMFAAGLVVQRAGFAEAPGLARWSPAIYALLVLFPGNAFSQREHIGVCLFLPMLAMMAWRMGGGPARPDAATAVLAGLCGSVLVLVKPYYAAMVLLPVLATCWRTRSARPLFVVEHWVIGAVCVAYLGAVQLLYPEFLGDVYPRLTEAYLSMRNFLATLLLFGPAALLLGLAVILSWPTKRPVPELAATAFLASIAGLAALLWQAKGWAYHAYPALACALLGLICLSCLPAARGGWRSRQPVRLARQGVLVAAVMAAFLPFWLTQKPAAAAVAAIVAAVERPSVVSISTDIATGHPLARMANGDYRLSHPNLWLVRSAERLMASSGANETVRLTALRDSFIAGAVAEIRRIRPDIILDSIWQTPAWLAIHADKGMQAELAGYTLLYRDDAVSVLIRADRTPGGKAEHGG
ncbi:MAG: hypothetical protein NTV73_00280 [Hyphomicrobiales bacterium]|nr:hypothetical protein [Hyphomicrobiales bacterium]